MKLNIHNIIAKSKVNGPGTRFCLWTQGCSRNCKGCFNKDSHSFFYKNLIPVEEITEKIFSTTGIEGISISGGEPFEQPEEIFQLLKNVKKRSSLSTLVFTGFTLEELNNSSLFKKILFYIDIIIAGPYIEEKRLEGDPLISSSNQKIHFLSEKYNIDDLNSGNLEIIIDKDGILTLTGTSQVKF